MFGIRLLITRATPNVFQLDLGGKQMLIRNTHDLTFDRR